MIRFSVVLCLLFIGLTCPAKASLEEAVAICRSIQAALARLNCYDAAATQGEPVDVPESNAIADVRGAWRHNLDKDPMSDFENSFWLLDADKPLRGRLNESIRPVLVIACRDDKTDLYVSWGQYITTGDLHNRHTVRHRVDAARVQTSLWGMATNFEATFAPSPIALVRSLAAAERLIVETTPYGESSITAQFELAGIDDVIADIRSRCHW